MKSLSDLQNLLSEDEKKKLALEKEKRDKQEIEAERRIRELTVKEMNVECFPAFIRMNYPHLREYSNAVLFDLGREFKKYLEDVFKGKMKKGEEIWNIEIASVVMRKMTDPFAINGYHPAFVLHYLEFIDKMKKENKK